MFYWAGAKHIQLTIRISNTDQSNKENMKIESKLGLLKTDSVKVKSRAMERNHSLGEEHPQKRNKDNAIISLAD